MVDTALNDMESRHEKVINLDFSFTPHWVKG